MQDTEEMEEGEKAIIRVTIILEELVKKVDSLTIKVNHIESDRNTFIVNNTSDVSVLKEKIRRLEMIIYGGMGVVLTQLIGLLFLLFKSK